MPIMKELNVLAVHGDTDRERAQEILDEKSRRAPPKDHVGAHDPVRGPFLHETQWPKAACDVLVVATDETGKTRLELAIDSFEQAVEIKQGMKITMVIGTD